MSASSSVRPRQHPFEAGVARALERATAGIGLGQHRVDHHRLALVGAVEQGEPAVAVAEEAQGRSHPVHRMLQGLRHLDPRRPQRRAQVDQVAQHGQMGRRAARGVAAVGQHLAIDLAGQQAQRLGQPRLRSRQRQLAEESTP